MHLPKFRVALMLALVFLFAFGVTCSQVREHLLESQTREPALNLAAIEAAEEQKTL